MFEECPECEDKFTDLRSLTDHFNAAHGDSDDNELQESQARSKKQSKSQALRATPAPTSLGAGESQRNLAEKIKREVQRKIKANLREPSVEVQSPSNLDSKSRQRKSLEAREEAPAPVGSRREKEDCLSAKKARLVKTNQPPLSLVFYPDSQVERIRDVGAARAQASSEEPFLNSFLAFFHKKESLVYPREASDTVPTITYDKDISVLDDDKVVEEKKNADEVMVDVVTLVDDGDPLLEHIEASGLPLKFRRPTVTGKIMEELS